MLIKNEITQIVAIPREIWPNYGDFDDEIRWYIYRGFDMNVAVEDGQVIGFVMHRCFKDGGNIGWFAVKENYRGRGIGTALLKAAEEAMLAEGAKFFFVDSDPKSNWQFYVRRGYEKIADIYLPDEGNTQLFVKWVGKRNVEKLARVMRPWLTTVYESIDDEIIRKVEEAIRAAPSPRRL